MKRSRTKSHKEGFGGFRKLSRSEVGWLKQDAKKELKRTKELPTSTAETSVFLNLGEGNINREQLLEAERFARQLRLAREISLVVNGALKRSKWCGVFLGELIPFLARNESDLMANEHFKRSISEFSSAQR